MTIRPLSSHDEVAAKIFLQNHLCSSLFMLSNMDKAGCDYKNAPYHGEYWASFTPQGEINGLLAHYWNGNIMVQAPDQPVLHSLQRMAFSNISRPVAGFIGPDDQIDYVLSNAPFSPIDYAKDEREDLYNLDLQNLTYPTHINAKLVHARDMDKGLFITWMRDYNKEALGYDHNRATQDANDRYTRMIEGTDMWTLYINNNPVSICGVNARVGSTVQVGPVWTPPELRGQAFARTVVGMALEHEYGLGVKNAILFTANPAAAKGYLALGFKKIGGFKLALLRKTMEIVP